MLIKVPKTAHFLQVHLVSQFAANLQSYCILAIMERVLFNIHSQVCNIALQRTSSRVRSLAEHTLLLVAVCGFGVLIVSHLSFVHRLGTVKSYPTRTTSAITSSSSRSIPRNCLMSIPGFRPEVDVTHILLSNGPETAAYTQTHQLPSTRETTCDATHPSANNEENESCRESYTPEPLQPMLSQENTTLSLSYSGTKGFLWLSPATCLKHNISTQFVHVSQNYTPCFGEPFLQTIVTHILGPERVVLNWLVGVYEGQAGYVYNPRTQHILDLHQQQVQLALDEEKKDSDPTVSLTLALPRRLVFKLGVVMTSLFLFFITTTLVSFTLRETQERMLEFTFGLQAHVRAQRPLAQLVVMHLTEILVFVPIMVGMMFFLIEFYGGDKFLAFTVLSIVWVCEVFSVISMRTTQGMQFFPKTFFLLFTLFHVYFFSFPFGFSYTALASMACFTLHSMLFFWHRYELPAVARGLVTLDAPRMGAAPSIGNTPTTAAMTAAASPLPVMPQDLNDTSAAVPQLAPRQPLVRQHSHDRSFPSLSSLGGRNSLSRPSSSIGLFNQHGDDGEDDESYMYFMNGEIVMHRDRSHHNRHTTPSPSLGGGSHQSTGSAERIAGEIPPTGGVPQRITVRPSVTETPVTTATSPELVPSAHDVAFSPAEELTPVVRNT